MEHLRELREDVEIVEEEGNELLEVRNSFLADPGASNSAFSIRGGGRDKGWKMVGTISASLCAMVPLVGKLAMLLAPQGRSSKRVKDAIRLLKEDLEEVSSYLDKLSGVEDPPPTAMCWMNEARDMPYEMEDYIYNIYEEPKDPSIVATTSRDLRKLTSHFKTPKRLERTITEFRMYVQEVIKRRKVYGLLDSGPSSESSLRRRYVAVGPMLPTTYEETAKIVIDGRMNEFITSVAKDGDQQLKVISVFGSARLGKTSLARVLYDRFGKEYNCRAFIRVSRKPDMKRIFHDMLSQLQGQHPPQGCKESNLIDHINNYLHDKRYLIIVDDICTASEWNIVNQAFPKSSHGSRIITTTQMEDVALTCCRYQSEHVFEMTPLDEDHSRKLFFNRIYGSESHCPQQFYDILTKIAEICGGLPLATISIASLLASQPVITIDLLTYIHQWLSSCFLANSTSDRTRQALNLSFNNLPQYLRTCLLYLSMRQEGYTFCKDDLVKEWMAEGFIVTTEGQDAEDVAESYLLQLIDRRFIQPISINYNNEVVFCAVHDAVHDLIAHKSAEENFILAIDYSQKTVALSRKVRRLSLLFGDARYARTPANIRKPQVRSLTFFGLLECMPCITEFKLLCVLNLQLSDHGGEDNTVDLSGISEMCQLRYLKIASDICIKLPKHGLQCLETLDIRDARVAVDGVIPCVPFIHLPHLLHLSLSDQIKLLNWVYNLVCDGKLKHLQDLRIITPTSDSYNLELIMRYLRSIIGSSSHKLKTVVVYHGSSVKKDVVHGTYEVADAWNDVILPPLLQRFEFVTHNRIMFSRVPLSIEKHGNLCILKIEVRDLEMSCVDILRGLPALTTLSLHVKIVPFRRIMFGKAGFSVLKYFKLRFRSGIAWLNFNGGAMPNLCKLRLVLDAVPRMDQQHDKRGTAVISIEHMPGLKDISAKFGGAAADVEYALSVGVRSHPSNPAIRTQPVGCSFHGDERSKLKQQEQPDEIVVEEQDEYNKKQQDQILEEEPESERKQQPAEIPVETQDEYCDQKQPEKILEEEPDEYLKPLPDKILEEEYLNDRDDNMDEELDEFHKKQPDDNLGGEPGEHDKTMERPADTSISSSPGPPFRLHVPEKRNTMDGNRIEPRRMKLDYLMSITEGFSRERIIGAGSYGIVYMGHDGNGEKIAVKVFHDILTHDHEHFERELLNLASLQHKNIVRLVGYCHETQRELAQYEGRLVLADVTKRALCFEHMLNGSLDKYISDEFYLHDWHKLYAIIKGICHGLKYLHEELQTPMYHLDLKPANVLLDENMIPKLTGFGLSRLFGEEEKSVIGTLGYRAPEYIDGGLISNKFDIYSLGVVIIKIMIGPTGYSRMHEMSSQEFIHLVHVNWTQRLHATRVDLMDSYSEQVKSCIEIALSCVQLDRHRRPSIGVIVSTLNKTESMIQSLDKDIGSSMYKV